MQITCSGCGKQLPINDHHRGRKIQCGECKALVYVPSFIPAPSRWDEGRNESGDPALSDSIPGDIPSAPLHLPETSSRSQHVNSSFPTQPSRSAPSISDSAIIVTAVSCLFGLIFLVGATMLLTRLMSPRAAPRVELAAEESEPDEERTFFQEGYSMILPPGFRQESREETDRGYIVYRFRTPQRYQFTFAIIPDKSIDRYTKPPKEFPKALVKSVPELCSDDDAEVQPRQVTVDRMPASVFQYWIRETHRGVTFTYYMVAIDPGRKLVLKFAGKYGDYGADEENITLPEHWYDSLLTLRHLRESEKPEEPGPSAESTLSANARWYFPDNRTAIYEYEDGRTLIYENRNFAPYKMHGWDNGNVFYGREGYMVFSRRGYFQVCLGANEDQGPSLRGSDSVERHIRNFLDSVRGEAECNSGAEVAHLSCGIVHLGEIAYRTGTTLQFDADKERVVNDDTADAMLTKEYRIPWTV